MYYENFRSEQVKYLYFQDDEDLSFVKHFHNSYEFLFVTKGEIECEINSISYTLTAGKAIMLFPNQPHSYMTSTHSSSHLLVFSKDYVQTFHNEVRGHCFANPVIDYIDYHHYGNLKENVSSRFFIKSFLYDICNRFYQNSPLISIKDTQDELSAHIITYIQERYTENITLKTIAKELNYNYTYLSNYFNKTFKCSFPIFLNTFRLENAIYLLDHTNENITYIAISSGFSTIRSFNIAFKNRYQVSPSNYRKKIFS